MNFKKYKFHLLGFLGIAIFATSCFKDLDTIPIDPDSITAATVYDDPASYRQVLAKLYAGLAVSGQEGPHGQSDIEGIDEGFGQYLRGLWYHQELATDECVIGWNDQTIKDYHEQDWDANDPFIYAFYSRVFYQITVCNEFLRETTDEKLSSRGVDDALKAEITGYRAEARFLRALSYYHALDHFRNVPFVTDADKVGFFFPEQIQGPDLYTYIETELLELENLLPEAGQNQYGRADRAAAWMVLAKLYLNAEVYTNKSAYTECLTYCNKVINAGYELEPVYEHLFLADNHKSNEVIFAIPFDGINTRTWGGTTFIVRAGIGGNMNALDDFGVESGWGGTRSTKALVEKFPAVASDQGGGFVIAPNSGNEEYPEIYVPGSFVSWNPANAPALTSPTEDDNYEGFIWLEANDQIKFTTERNFTENYGDDGADGTLDNNGDNIKVTETGYHYLKVDLANLTYSLEKTDWGLIGSATANGWDADTDMTFDADENAWVIETFLTAGEVKFRANDDWAINFGDTAADALLELEGDNIAIPSNSNYRIKLFLDKPDYTYSIEITSTDKRATFHTDGQNLEITDIAQFTEGYAVIKFKNINSDGTMGSNLVHVDTDFPMFRLADVYLMYAECVLRGGAGGDIATAVQYVNDVRFRAYGDLAGAITDSDLTLDFLLDERARELFWEAHRRQDLVRFGQFSNGSYVWPWKGGVPEGAAVSQHFDVYPIPSTDLGVNPNLIQNEGY